MRTQGRDLYLFQMRVTGAIKIGRSSNPERRIKQLQVGSPHRLRVLMVVPNQGGTEKDLHRRLNHHRLRVDKGEWFGPDCLWDLPIPLYELLDLEMLDWWKRS